MAGTLTIAGMSAGLLTGQKTIGPITMQGAAVVGQITDVTLAVGDNTLAVPSAAVAVLIELPAGNAAALKLRTNLDAADAGVQVGPVGFVVFPLPSGTVSVIVNASASGGAIEASFI